MRILQVLLISTLLSWVASGSTLVLGPFSPIAPVGGSQYLTDWGIDPIFLATDGSIVINVPKFSPVWGTLNSVTLTLGGSIHGDYSLTSNDSSTQIFTITTSAELDLTEPDDGFGNFNVLVIDVPSVDAQQRLDPGLSTSGSSDSSLETTGSAFTTADVLSLFTGSGNVALPVSATGQSTIGGGAATGNVDTYASAYAKVTYDYTPAAVPEPGWTGGLVMLVLAAAELRRRRRK